MRVAFIGLIFHTWQHPNEKRWESLTFQGLFDHNRRFGFRSDTVRHRPNIAAEDIDDTNSTQGSRRWRRPEPIFLGQISGIWQHRFFIRRCVYSVQHPTTTLIATRAHIIEFIAALLFQDSAKLSRTLCRPHVKHVDDSSHSAEEKMPCTDASLVASDAAAAAANQFPQPDEIIEIFSFDKGSTE